MEDYQYFGSTPMLKNMNEKISTTSLMVLSRGLPPPWPALLSMRMRCGRSPMSLFCNAAAYLNECAGTTRSSWSAVVTRMAGYSFPFWMEWSGEYL